MVEQALGESGIDARIGVALNRNRPGPPVELANEGHGHASVTRRSLKE
jgi:hypothetical protein